MNTTTFDGTQDTFNSREVIDRIAELIAEWEDATGDMFEDYTLSADALRAGLSGDEATELHALIELRDDADGLADWEYGETFVSDDYFPDYARELAEDAGAINPNAEWPLTYIDWEAAAEELKNDYTEFEFMGATYYARY